MARSSTHIARPREARHALRHPARPRRCHPAYLSACTIAPAGAARHPADAERAARTYGGSSSHQRHVGPRLSDARSDRSAACGSSCARAQQRPHTSAVSPASSERSHTAQLRGSSRSTTPRQHRARVRASIARARDRAHASRGIVTASHITARGAGRANHRSNASAPCSMSIGSPSLARCPHARAARTHGVSPRRYTRSTTARVVRQRLDRHRKRVVLEPRRASHSRRASRPAPHPPTSPPCASRTGKRDASRASACGCDCRASPRTPATARPPRAPPPPRRRRRGARCVRAGARPSCCVTSVSKPPTSVLSPTSAPSSSTQNVFTAPTRSASGDQRVAQRAHAAPCAGS